MTGITVNTLLDQFPPFMDESILIEQNQVVRDIMIEIPEAHKCFTGDYDKIALYFDAEKIRDVCDNIYSFLKENVRYKEESDKDQTTSLPAGILTMGMPGNRGVDCKHYASFAGGILSALQRMGKRISWCYRFASYEVLDETPHHVFVVVNPYRDDEIWIDPTPGSENLTPIYYIDKKVKPMALRRIVAGLYTDDFQLPQEQQGVQSTDSYTGTSLPIEDFDFYNPETEDDSNLSPEIISSLELLLQYNVLDEQGNFNSAQLYALQDQLPGEQYKELLDASYFLEDHAAIGGLFQTIWRGVKKVTLAGPRGAYLGLVALNVFGLGAKLAQATSTTEGANKVRDVWYKLGGDWAKLRSAISNGQKRKRIMGIDPSLSMGAAAAAIPAWVTTALAIIAALAPVIKSILQRQQQDQVPYVEGYDPSLINTPDQTSSGPLDWIKSHPLESAGIALLAFVALKKFKVLR